MPKLRRLFIAATVAIGVIVGAAIAPAPSYAQFMGTYAPMHRARISGTITAVSGHLVTIQQSRGSIVINDGPALKRQRTGKVAVGRQIVAVGYWHRGTFYATSIH